MPHLSPPLVTLATTAAATVASAYPLGRALRASGRLDMPNHRSSHSTPTPRGGGIALLVGAGTAALLTGRRPSAIATTAVLGLAGLGLADDLSGHLSARVRLATQLAIGAGLLGHREWDRALAGVATAGVVNVVNFMDGINGISGLAAVVWGVNAMVLHDESEGDLTKLGALTAGAGAGFLPHNLPTARLFLGDVGSYALGGAMAAGILSQSSLTNRYRVAAPLLLYGADAAQALLRRTLAGAPITEAHRDHVYQRLVDLGLTHNAVSATHAVGAIIAASLTRLPQPIALAGQIILIFAYLNSPRFARAAGCQSARTLAAGLNSPIGVHPTQRSDTRTKGDR